jgi:hypothetical protein
MSGKWRPGATASGFLFSMVLWVATLTPFAKFFCANRTQQEFILLKGLVFATDSELLRL